MCISVFDEKLMAELMFSRICQILCKIDENVDFRYFYEKLMAEPYVFKDLLDFM